jgi:ribosome maturation factor RimP
MQKEKIQQIVESYIADSDAFIVAIRISTANKITVLLDTPEGISIEACVKLSRHIEKQLDRDQEDYELMVSSPGLTEPLLVLPQYKKRLGRQLQVLTTEKERLKGTLLEADENGILLETEKKEKGKKEVIKEKINLAFPEIEKAKLVIDF